MAAIPRTASTGAPTVDTAGVPVYAPASPYAQDSRSRWVVALRSPSISGQGTYTGTIALPRNTPRDPVTGGFLLSPEQEAASRMAALTAASQRAQLHGLPPSAVPALADAFQGVGRFPDLAELEAGTGFGGVYVDPSRIGAEGGGGGGALGPGGSPLLADVGGIFGAGGLSTWIILSVVGLGLFLLFGPAGRKRGR